MSTSDLDELRAEIVREVYSVQHSHTKTPHTKLNAFEAAVDAKARADERERAVQAMERLHRPRRYDPVGDGATPATSAEWFMEPPLLCDHCFGHALWPCDSVRVARNGGSGDAARIVRDNEGTTTP